MRFTVAFFHIINTLTFTAFAAKDVQNPYPLGISLGPRLISVAQATDDARVKQVVQVTGSDVYQASYKEMKQGSLKDRFSTIASLKIILSDIRHAAEAVLGSYPTEHISIALPNEISTFTNKNIILEAALAARVGIARRPRETEDRIHFIKHKDALQYAYDLGTCAGLGQVVGCFDKTQIAISVDYHEDSLDVMILDVTEGRCSVSGSMSSPDLGSPKHSENATLNDAQQSRYTLIWTTLDSFMKSHFAPDEDEDIPPSDPTTPIQRPRRSDIRAVVLSGDASSQGFENLRPFLQAMFSDLVGSHDEWLRESIEPSWVAAVGAAKHAKRRTQHGLPGRHDEL